MQRFCEKYQQEREVELRHKLEEEQADLSHLCHLSYL